MSNLEIYINNLKEYFSKNPDLTETEKVMYVYLDLGKRFKFDQDFYFGGSKARKRIYTHSSYQDYLEESFDRNTIICKSSARICQYIFAELGITCLNHIDEHDERNYKHVYNIIVPKDGSEEYSIDLQNDIENIEFHAFTKDFGLSTDGEERYVISRNEQKRIHEKFGYVSDKNPYMDDYVYLFKQTLDGFPDFNSKIDLILQNIDPEKLDGIDYWERRWKHQKFIDNLLPEEETCDRLHLVELYNKDENGKKRFYNTYFVLDKGEPIIYIYSEKDYKYNKYSLEEFARLAIEKGFETTEAQKIPKVRAEIQKIKEEEGR